MRGASGNRIPLVTHYRGVAIPSRRKHRLCYYEIVKEWLFRYASTSIETSVGLELFCHAEIDTRTLDTFGRILPIRLVVEAGRFELPYIGFRPTTVASYVTLR